MASDRSVFLRPIVVGDDEKNFSVSGTAITLTTGTYASIAHLCKHIQSKVISAAGPPDDFAVSFSSSFKVVFAAGSAYTVTWTDTNLRDILGFTGNLSSASTHTATYTPTHCWVPSRARGDNDEWTQDLKEQWRGVEVRSGNVVGFRTGVTIYRTSLEYNAVPSEEVFISRATSSVHRYRCLEYFVEQSREVWGSVDQPSPGGFYFYPDRDDVAIGTAATFTSGDASKFNYSSSPEIFSFCAFDSGWYPKPKPSLSVRCDYGDVVLDIHSAEAPTWTGGD